MNFSDKVKINSDRLTIIIQPVDSKEPKVYDVLTGEVRDLTYNEWKALNPKPKRKWSKE